MTAQHKRCVKTWVKTDSHMEHVQAHAHECPPASWYSGPPVVSIRCPSAPFNNLPLHRLSSAINTSFVSRVFDVSITNVLRACAPSSTPTEMAARPPPIAGPANPSVHPQSPVQSPESASAAAAATSPPSSTAAAAGEPQPTAKTARGRGFGAAAASTAITPPQDSSPSPLAASETQSKRRPPQQQQQQGDRSGRGAQPSAAMRKVVAAKLAASAKDAAKVAAAQDVAQRAAAADEVAAAGQALMDIIAAKHAADQASLATALEMDAMMGGGLLPSPPAAASPSPSSSPLSRDPEGVDEEELDGWWRDAMPEGVGSARGTSSTRKTPSFISEGILQQFDRIAAAKGEAGKAGEDAHTTQSGTAPVAAPSPSATPASAPVATLLSADILGDLEGLLQADQPDRLIAPLAAPPPAPLLPEDLLGELEGLLEAEQPSRLSADVLADLQGLLESTASGIGAGAAAPAAAESSRGPSSELQSPQLQTGGSAGPLPSAARLRFGASIKAATAAAAAAAATVSTGAILPSTRVPRGDVRRSSGKPAAGSLGGEEEQRDPSVHNGKQQQRAPATASSAGKTMAQMQSDGSNPKPSQQSEMVNDLRRQLVEAQVERAALAAETSRLSAELAVRQAAAVEAAGMAGAVMGRLVACEGLPPADKLFFSQALHRMLSVLLPEGP